MSNDNKLPTYEAGDVDQPYSGDRGNDYWVAAIDRTSPTTHGAIVECYGATEEEATALRDRLLAALPAEKPAAAAEHLIDSVYSALTDHDKRYTSRENVAAVLRAMPAAAAERGAEWPSTEESLAEREERRYNAVLAAEDSAQAAEPAQVDERLLGVIASLGAALRKLSLMAQTTGGTAGPDAGLQEAIADAQQALSLSGIAQAMDAALTQRPAAPLAPDAAALERDAHRYRVLRERVDPLNGDLELSDRGTNPPGHVYGSQLDDTLDGYTRPAAPLATDAGAGIRVGEPGSTSLVITLRQAERLIAFFGGHDTEVTVMARAGSDRLLAYVTDYPEEGYDDLGPTEVDDELATNGRPVAAHPAEERLAQGEALEPHPPHRQCPCTDCAPSFAAQASPAPVPDEQAGEWQWVPKVPTQKMVEAGRWSEYGEETSRLHKVDDEAVQSVYAYMLSAAPPAPSRPVAAEKREPLPEDLFVFLDACAGEGYVMSGVDAGDLCIRLFPDRFPSLHGIGTHNSTGDGACVDPTDPGYDVDVLREHVRHLERHVRQLNQRGDQ